MLIRNICLIPSTRSLSSLILSSAHISSILLQRSLPPLHCVQRILYQRQTTGWLLHFHSVNHKRPNSISSCDLKFRFHASRSDQEYGSDMADARYCVEYAKTGRSSCKKCKSQIEKGVSRVGKITTNPFSDDGGEMKVWYHTRCMFETLKVIGIGLLVATCDVHIHVHIYAEVEIRF